MPYLAVRGFFVTVVKHLCKNLYKRVRLLKKGCVFIKMN